MHKKAGSSRPPWEKPSPTKGRGSSTKLTPAQIAATIDDVPLTSLYRHINALAEGGKVTMPMAASFWVERFGMLTDRFGVGWMVNAGPSKL